MSDFDKFLAEIRLVCSKVTTLSRKSDRYTAIDALRHYTKLLIEQEENRK